MTEVIKLDMTALAGKKPAISPTKGSWVAGGAVRQWLTGDEKASDIDVFAESKEAAEKFMADRCSGWRRVASNPTATTMKSGRLIVQVIHHYHDSIAACLDAFDFTLCQFAWDGEQAWATPNALISIARRHLAVHKIQAGFELDSLRRAFKYAEKGYKPCWGTFRDIANSLRTLDDEGVKRQVEMSPGGGSRIVRFD